MRPTRASPLVASWLLVLVPACGDPPEADAAPAPAAPARSADPLVVAARRAIEGGRLDEARALLRRLDGDAEVPNDANVAKVAKVERLLLRARAAALSGEDTEVTPLVEAARALDPKDPRVYATAAELHAAAGRLETADAEIQRGLRACGGATPELERARGVTLISQPGGAPAGLRLLESARRKDPGLPFADRPLGQAHLVLGKLAAKRGAAGEALVHAKTSLEFDARDVDARRFFAEMLAAQMRFGEALAVFEELVEEGVPLAGELASLYKNAGVAALTQHERPLAIRYFLRARELGMSEAELRTGAHVLRDEAFSRAAQALVQREAGDAEGARENVAEALRLDPGHAERAREKALAAYRAGDPDAARTLARQALLVAPDAARVRALDAALRAQAAYAAKELERAEALASEAVQLDPESAVAREQLATCLVHRALQAHRADDLKVAEDLLREAIECDETALEAHNYLGVVLFQLDDAAGAAREWEQVIDGARRQGRPLPDPVHLNLAQALWIVDGPESARRPLEAYLRAEPDGPFVEETQRALDAMSAAGDGGANGGR